MIDSLTGKLVEKTPDSAVVQCNGVGYLATMPAPDAAALPAIGDVATVYTTMQVSDNSVALYGFADKESRTMYRLLNSVTGVGPKVAIAILSALTADEIALAVHASDYDTLSTANGVGPKLAQRLALELKDKVSVAESDGTPSASAAARTDATAQAVGALISLGYTNSEAASAVATIDGTLPVEEIIRLALQGMGGN